MPDTHDESPEKFDHPVLSEEEDARQRGEDPDTVRRDPPPKRPYSDPDRKKRRDEIQGYIDRWLKEKGRVRQNGTWPYLLIRAVPGDHGVRPITGTFWESPDIIVVPGDVQTYDGVSATLQPRVGAPHTIFVHVWNIGRLAAVHVKLRVFWANPSFSFTDPMHPPHLIGSTALYLPDRQNANCHGLVRLPAPWIPVIENGGHECLLAKVDCFADGGGPGFDARQNRHVAQRNLTLVQPDTNLAPLFEKLGAALPLDADLELVHGMHDLQPALRVHQPQLMGRLASPGEIPARAFALPAGYAHLGALVRGAAVEHIVPSAVAGSAVAAGRLDATVLTHARVRAVARSRHPVMTMLRGLGFRDFTARSMAMRLAAEPTPDGRVHIQTGVGHMLRIIATREGQVVGGYTFIVGAEDARSGQYQGE